MRPPESVPSALRARRQEFVAEVGQIAEMADDGSRRVVGAVFDALDSVYLIWGPTVRGPARTVPAAEVLEGVDFDP